MAAGQTCLPLAPREPGFLSTQMFAARTTRFLNSFLLIDTTATAHPRGSSNPWAVSRQPCRGVSSLYCGAKILCPPFRDVTFSAI